MALTTAWRAWFLLAILAASSGAQAQPATLTAARDDTGITIEWTGPAGDFTVVVAREDPLEGRVVERVVPVQLEANAKLVLPGTHPGAVEVRVNEGGALARATPAIDLPHPELGAEEPLATAQIHDGALGSAGPVSFQAHRVSDDRAHEVTARLLVAGGAVVAAWMHVARDGGPDGPPVCWIRVASSLDGGRQFGPPLTVAGPLATAEPNEACHGIHHWSATSLAGGFVLLGHDARGDAEGARLYVIDPISAAIVWQGPMGLGFDGAFALTPATDGGFFVAGHRASGSGHALVAGVSTWHGHVAGDVRLMASEPSSWVYEMHGGATAGTVAFAWSQHDALGYSISRDGGETFAGGAFDDYRESQLNLDGFAVSRGVLHAAVANHVTGQAHYLRDAPHGVDVKAVCGGPGSLLDDCERGQYLKLAAAGPRVWLLFEGFLNDQAASGSETVAFYVAESTNGGGAYTAPLRLAEEPGNRLSSPYHMTISPDGRPLLFAHAFLAGSDGEEAADAVVPLFDPLGDVAVENGVRAPTLFANDERPSLLTAGNASRDETAVRVPIVIENRRATSLADLRFSARGGEVVATIPPYISLAPGQSLAATAIVTGATDELTLVANSAGQSFTTVVALPPSVAIHDPAEASPPPASREPRESIPAPALALAVLALALPALRRRS